MATRYEYFISDELSAGDVSTTTWRGQSFKPQEPFTITSVKFKLSAPTEPTGNIEAYLYAAGDDHFPTGPLLASGSTPGSNVPSSAALVEITFDSGADLEPSVEYIVYLKRTATGGGSVAMHGDSTDTGYTRGTGSRNFDGTWYAENNDKTFETWGDGYTLPPTDKNYTKKLVAFANNQLWYESSAGTMSVLAAASDDINTADYLSAFELFGKIFIANKTRFKVADFINVKITTSDLGTNPPDYHTVLTGTSSGAKMVVDYISNLDDNEACTIYGHRYTTATFKAETVTGTDNDGNSISFTGTAEVAGPHWYDWTPFGDADDSHTTFGKLPNKATLSCNYRGRAVLAGNPELPHQWYMSRQSNPWDFAYGTNDAQSAVAGNNSDAGEVGDNIRALIPYKDDYLIFGCVNTMWILIGDPCSGGEINELDLTTGIFGPKAWCFDGVGNLYFWGTNGLYKCKVPETPVCISEQRLPNLVEDEAVDPSTHRITLSYDRKRAGIIIAITTLSDGSNSNYWYDLRALDENGVGGFFPETYPDECGIFSSHYYEAEDPNYRKLIVGCTDGYLRVFDKDTKDDKGTTDQAIDSYITFGPIPMALDPKLTGKLTGLLIVPAGGVTGGSQSDSDDIDYKVWTATTAENILEKFYTNTSPVIAGTINAPGHQRGSNIHRKIKGTYMGIRIGNNTANETWALEQLLFEIKPSGRLK